MRIVKAVKNNDIPRPPIMSVNVNNSPFILNLERVCRYIFANKNKPAKRKQNVGNANLRAISLFSLWKNAMDVSPKPAKVNDDFISSV